MNMSMKKWKINSNQIKSIVTVSTHEQYNNYIEHGV